MTKKTDAPEKDMVNKPPHYQSPFPIKVPDNYGDYIIVHIQALDVIKAWGLNFNLGNVIKYILRSGKKGTTEKYLEDLKKARFYLTEEIEALEEKNAGD